jgi:hypothetical protein
VQSRIKRKLLVVNGTLRPCPSFFGRTTVVRNSESIENKCCFSNDRSPKVTQCLRDGSMSNKARTPSPLDMGLSVLVGAIAFVTQCRFETGIDRSRIAIDKTPSRVTISFFFCRSVPTHKAHFLPATNNKLYYGTLK